MVTLVKTGYTPATYACKFFEEGHGTITVSPKADFQVGDVITFFCAYIGCDVSQKNAAFFPAIPT